MGTTLEEECAPIDEVCAQCDENLIYMEDVFAIHVMRAVIVNGVPTLQPLLDDEGEFMYEPYFLHFKCWEEIVIELKEERENSPPIPDEYGILRCDCCGSDIREHEPSLVATLGELIVSKRAPTSGRTMMFHVSGAPDVYCLWCLSTINEEHLEFWEDGVAIDGECTECQHVRCWRGFDCGCTCHEEEEDG
jgi:hypothetical protein